MSGILVWYQSVWYSVVANDIVSVEKSSLAIIVNSLNFDNIHDKEDPGCHA